MSTVIPLFKANSLGFRRDMVSFSVKYGNMPPTIAVAVIDTGCPYTILSENSLKRTRIPYQNKNTKYTVNLGNIPLQLKELGICKLYFRDENNQTVTFEQFVYAGVPNIKGYLAQELPSFIGKDFLDGNRFSIINREEGSLLTKNN